MLTANPTITDLKRFIVVSFRYAELLATSVEIFQRLSLGKVRSRRAECPFGLKATMSSLRGERPFPATSEQDAITRSEK